MEDLQKYQILPPNPDDEGLQKCHMGLNLFQSIGASLGQCAYICLKDNVVICKLWPESILGDKYIRLDSSVHFCQHNDQSLVNCTGYSRQNGVNFLSKDCIHISDLAEFEVLNVTVIVTDYKKVAYFRHNLTKLEGAVKETMHNFFVSPSFTIETKDIALGKLHGIELIKINNTSCEKEIQCGKISKETKLNIVRVESKDHFEQRNKYKKLKIGGLMKVKQSLKQLLEIPLLQKETLKSLGVSCPKSVLLRGPPGCGKTTLVKVAANECDAYLLSAVGPELIGSRPGETESNLKEIFNRAELLSQEGPSILFLDEIDSFSCKKGGASQDRRPLAQLVQLLDNVNENNGSLVIVAATNRPGDLDPVLRRPGRLDRELFIGVPNQEERWDILQVITKNMSLDSSIDLNWLAEATPGYVGADLKLLVQQAYYSTLDDLEENSEKKVCITENAMKQALHYTMPSSQKGSDVFVDFTPVQWDQIGGLDTVKQQIIQAIELPIKHPEAFRRLGLPPPKGVLLYGPPGCAKTTLVRAAATSCHVTFLAVSSAQLYSPYVGDSEKKISEIFKQARAGAPCILFLDEIDSLVGNRSKGSKQGGVQERLLSTLLNEMDGVGIKVDTLQTSSGSDKSIIAEHNVGDGEVNNQVSSMAHSPVDNNSVLVVAATNRPDMLDEAILRPGRMDKIIYVPPPDSKARLEILKVHTRKMAVDNEVDLQSLAEKTEYFTGADIENLCREAALHALSVDGLDTTMVNQGHFDHVLEKIQPSLTPQQLLQYQQIKFR